MDADLVFICITKSVDKGELWVLKPHQFWHLPYCCTVVTYLI